MKHCFLNRKFRVPREWVAVRFLSMSYNTHSICSYLYVAKLDNLKINSVWKNVVLNEWMLAGLITYLLLWQASVLKASCQATLEWADSQLFSYISVSYAFSFLLYSIFYKYTEWKWFFFFRGNEKDIVEYLLISCQKFFFSYWKIWKLSPVSRQ